VIVYTDWVVDPACGILPMFIAEQPVAHGPEARRGANVGKPDFIRKHRTGYQAES
jgi:hypothetical protein